MTKRRRGIIVKRILKVMVKTIGIIAMLMVMVFVLCSCISSCSRKNTVKQLQCNLDEEKATREELEQQVEELQTELAKKTEEADVAKQKQTEVTAGDSSLYLQAKFPSDGNYYVDANENVFYKDTTCTQVVDDPKFMSPAIDDNVEASNGFPIKALRLNTGEICYCPRDTGVYLVTEQEWQEYLKEQEENED